MRSTWDVSAPDDTIELVATEGERIVGHVLGAAGTVDGTRLLAVAPLGVVPDRQGQGVGSALMHEVIAQAEAAGWPAVVLLGAPAYYSRFGFEPAWREGIVYPPMPPKDPHFQLRRLSTYKGSIAGSFRYCWERD